MDITLFPGRFHPLVVHLAIKLTLIRGIMHFISTEGKYKKLDSAVSFILFPGVFFAIIAAFLGWFVADDKLYDPDTLFLHQWFGIIMVFGSILIYLIRFRAVKVSSKRNYQI